MSAPNARRELQLLSLAGALVLAGVVALSLAPYARAGTWQAAGADWRLWTVPPVWLACAAGAAWAARRALPEHDPYVLPLVYLLTGWGLLLIWRLAPGFGVRQTVWLGVATAALCALVERGRTGKGQFIEVGMLEVLSSMLNTLVPDYEVNGELARRYGQRPFDRFGGSFKAKDAYFTLAPATPKMWETLCKLMGHPEWADPSVGRRPGYVADPELRKTIDRTVEEWAAQRTAEEAVETLQKLGIPSGVVRTVERIFEEELNKPGSRVLDKVKLPGNPKPVTIPGRPFRFPDEPAGIKDAPGLNADTFDVLSELGVSNDELKAFEASGVIVRPAVGSAAKPAA